MSDDTRLTTADVKSIRAAANTVLALNLKMYGTDEQKEQYKNDPFPPLDAKVGTEANRLRAQLAHEVADKIEERLSA